MSKIVGDCHKFSEIITYCHRLSQKLSKIVKDPQIKIPKCEKIRNEFLKTSYTSNIDLSNKIATSNESYKVLRFHLKILRLQKKDFNIFMDHSGIFFGNVLIVQCLGSIRA